MIQRACFILLHVTKWYNKKAESFLFHKNNCVPLMVFLTVNVLVIPVMKDLMKWSKMTDSLWFINKQSKTGVKILLTTDIQLSHILTLVNGFIVIQFKIRCPMQWVVGITNTMAVFSHWKWWWRLIFCIPISV